MKLYSLKSASTMYEEIEEMVDSNFEGDYVERNSDSCWEFDGVTEADIPERSEYAFGGEWIDYDYVESTPDGLSIWEPSEGLIEYMKSIADESRMIYGD